MLEATKNEIIARQKLTKENLEAETPTRSFCSTISMQKKKNGLAHLRRRREKTDREKIIHPHKEFHEDKFTQEGIMEDLCSFYNDLYEHRSAKPRG